MQPEDRMAETIKALRDVMRDSRVNHGGFIAHLAAGEFEQAAFTADGFNLAHFGELVRERARIVDEIRSATARQPVK